ncbi:MAG: hypothetical protein KDB88_12265, partial [Flavobacteriales bacterium]|nr:hypothetical protein [Flavobacteriales bacterium]
MKNWGKPQLLALAGSLVVAVLLMWLPRTEEVPTNAAAPARMTIDDRIAEAVALVNGSEPMKGIMALRDLEKEHPDHAGIHMQLGLFSVQSGQLDKAVQRFERVAELDPKGYPEAYAMLGRSYAAMDSIGPAVEAIERYKELTSDPEA